MLRHKCWCYRDPQGVVQGPFSTLEMRHWDSCGYFGPDLPIRYAEGGYFYPLRVLFPHPMTPFHSLPVGVGPPRQPPAMAQRPSPPRGQGVGQQAQRQSPPRGQGAAQQVGSPPPQHGADFGEFASMVDAAAQIRSQGLSSLGMNAIVGQAPRRRSANDRQRQQRIQATPVKGQQWFAQEASLSDPDVAGALANIWPVDPAIAHVLDSSKGIQNAGVNLTSASDFPTLGGTPGVEERVVMTEAPENESANGFWERPPKLVKVPLADTASPSHQGERQSQQRLGFGMDEMSAVELDGRAPGGSRPSRSSQGRGAQAASNNAARSPNDSDSARRPAEGFAERRPGGSSPPRDEQRSTGETGDTNNTSKVNRRRRAKGKEVDPSLLGFTAASSRIMKGSIHYGE